MTILITGAAGFIGSHTCESLLQDGNIVIGLDNFDPFYNRQIKESNLGGIINHRDFHFVEGDICDKELLTDLFSKYPIDLVIHLAAKAGVRPSMTDIESYYYVNVTGTVSLLEVMRKHSISRLIFASSSSVYGNNTKVPFSEEDFVDHPISPYAATKKAGELLCHVYHQLYNFDIFCLRFFTVYGPRQRPDLAIHKFARLIREDKAIPFYGDGKTARDYTYIDDIVSGIRTAIKHLRGFQVYNLGESRVVTLNELVMILESMLGKKAILDTQDFQAGDVQLTYADIRKAKTELGYKPVYSLEEGIRKFVDWLNEQK